MMNIGIKPTLNKSSKTIEVNFFEFEGDLYNTKITVSIKQFIRDEIKFDSLELLKSQIRKTKSIVIQLLILLINFIKNKNVISF
jgi:riboflavin kinase/FMN adenylyltransferase